MVLTMMWTLVKWLSKIAGSMAFKEGARKASPVLLEPIMRVEVVTPEEYMGDVMGDLKSSSRYFAGNGRFTSRWWENDTR